MPKYSVPYRCNRIVGEWCQSILFRLKYCGNCISRKKIGGLNSDQFLISLLIMPDIWMQIPFITVSNPELTSYYNLSAKQCAYIQFFDNGHYKLQEKLKRLINAEPTHAFLIKTWWNWMSRSISFTNSSTAKCWTSFHWRMTPIISEHAPEMTCPLCRKRFHVRIPHHGLVSGRSAGIAERSNDWTKANEVAGMINTYQQAKNKTLDISPKRYNQN